ncbi:MAG: PEP-CTERM sorting domain-containing protein [Pirellulales bacterium]|nr:PEP-CTERM sorting domain-containing protein [Pirellulales bacterium]
MRLTRWTSLCALVALTAALAASSIQAAFIVEARAGGKATANFSFGGDTTSASTSTASSAAVGSTPGIGSFFGGNGTVADTYVYSYTPGTNADNTTYAAGQVLGSTTGFPGNGNLATGATGGASGLYNVYVTVPESTNVNVLGSNFTITQNGPSIVLPLVNLNNGGTGPDTDPGTAFVGGANNAWFRLGTVLLDAGTTYSVTQASNSATFVSQRGFSVMWEAVGTVIPEPATLSLAAMGLIGMIAAARRKS